MDAAARTRGPDQKPSVGWPDCLPNPGELVAEELGHLVVLQDLGTHFRVLETAVEQVQRVVLVGGDVLGVPAQNRKQK